MRKKVGEVLVVVEARGSHPPLREEQEGKRTKKRTLMLMRPWPDSPRRLLQLTSGRQQLCRWQNWASQDRGLSTP